MHGLGVSVLAPNPLYAPWSVLQMNMQNIVSVCSLLLRALWQGVSAGAPDNLEDGGQQDTREAELKLHCSALRTQSSIELNTLVLMVLRV